MSYSKRNTLSNRRRDRRLGSKSNMWQRTTNFLQVAYKGDDPEQEAALAREIASFGGSAAHLCAAEALSDTAFRHAKVLGANAIHLFAESGRHAIKAKELAPNGLTGIVSDQLVKLIPQRINLTENKIPSTEAQTAAYEKRVAAIPAIFELWDKSRGIPNSEEQIGKLKGFMSEEATGLLLARYAIYEIGAEDWFPISSTLSQDHGQISNSTFKSGWDISIYQPSIPISESFRLQVKSHINDEYTGVYFDDIDLIDVSALYPNDDSASKSIYQKPQYILNELFDESTGNDRATARLDSRTQFLLDQFN